MAEHNPVVPQSDTQVDKALLTIPAESLNRGYEVRPINTRAVLTFIIALLVSTAVICIVLWWTLSSWQGESLVPRAQIPPMIVTIEPAPGPFPVVGSAANLEKLVNAANDNIHNYGWVDQKAGVVRIPIDRAMTLLLQRGLPARKDQPPTFGLDDAHQMDGAGGQESGNEYTTR